MLTERWSAPPALPLLSRCARAGDTRRAAQDAGRRRHRAGCERGPARLGGSACCKRLAGCLFLRRVGFLRGTSSTIAPKPRPSRLPQATCWSSSLATSSRPTSRSWATRTTRRRCRCRCAGVCGWWAAQRALHTWEGGAVGPAWLACSRAQQTGPPTLACPPHLSADRPSRPHRRVPAGQEVHR